MSAKMVTPKTKDEKRIKHWYNEMEKDGPRARYEVWVESEAERFKAEEVEALQAAAYDAYMVEEPDPEAWAKMLELEVIHDLF